MESKRMGIKGRSQAKEYSARIAPQLGISMIKSKRKCLILATCINIEPDNSIAS